MGSATFRFNRGYWLRGHSLKALEIAQGLETAAKYMRELTKGVSHEASQATVQEVH